MRPHSRAVACFACLLLAISARAPLVGQNATPPSTGRPTPFAVAARVDQRVELMSIVARLAGYPEYVNNSFKSYAAEVDAFFAPYKQHPAVRFAAQIRADREVSFDAVMSMAVHLGPPPALTARVPFTDSVPDPRWTRAGAAAFAPLLQQFYRDANCEQFFRSHAGMYKTAEGRFQIVLNKVDFDWYRKFYGEVPAGSFNLYVGLLNGGANYGPKVIHADLSEDRYAIIGAGQVDNEGLPVFNDGALPTIIHEYNHSFINPLVHAAMAELRPAGETIFAPVAGRLKPWAYGDWQTALIESLVRAGVIRYQFDHDREPSLEYTGMVSERNRGFLWIGDLITLMGTYEHDRAAFPTFRSFFPLIVSYFKELSTRIDADAKRFDDLSPKVVGVVPFANGADNV